MKEKKSIRHGLLTMFRGLVETGIAVGQHADYIVKHYPWEVVISTLVISSVTSIVFMTGCRYKQVTAEQQRDSVSIILDSVKQSQP